MAGLQGSPIGYIGPLSGVVDFDNLKPRNGIWLVGRITDEGSVSKPRNYGTLIQFGEGYPIQMFFSHDSYMLFRSHNGSGVWNDWYEVTKTKL